MNKKGFTLIELLAVIVLLGLLSTLGISMVIKNSNESKKRTKYLAAKEIVTIADAYFTTDGSDKTEVSVKTLINNEYLNDGLINPRNNKREWDSGEQDGTLIKQGDYTLQTDYNLKECGTKKCYQFDGYAYILK